MIDDNHLLVPAKYIPSPNFNNRPGDIVIDLLVIHCIALPPDIFYGDCIENFFTNKLDIHKHNYFAHLEDVKVSSHILIRRNGFVMQFVPFNERAWHAGDSEFKGRKDCNDFSIGIELEGSENSFFTEAQYENLAKITKNIQYKYPSIIDENIVGHQDIAPGRKTDPGPYFDWEHFLLLKSRL